MVCVAMVDDDDVIREGISGERRTSKGQRERMPMDDNIYAVGRPNNLRVEFGKK